MRPAQVTTTTPLLPVMPRSRGRIDEDAGKVRDFHTQAKRENNLLESNFHVKARIGFKRARASGIRLRPLDPAVTPGLRRRLPPFHPPAGLPPRHAAAALAEPARHRSPPPAAPPATFAAQAPPAAATPVAGRPPPAPAQGQPAPPPPAGERLGAVPASSELRGPLSPREAPAAPPTEDTDLEVLRKRTASVLLQAEEDGSLFAALSELKVGDAEDVADAKAPSRAPTRTPSIQVAHDLAQEVSRVAVEEVMLSIRGENPVLSSPRNVMVIEE